MVNIPQQKTLSIRMKRLDRQTLERNDVYSLEDSVKKNITNQPSIACGLWFRGTKVCPNRRGCCIFTQEDGKILDIKGALKEFKCRYTVKQVQENIVRDVDLYNTRW
jgi:hypothetical protein